MSNCNCPKVFRRGSRYTTLITCKTVSYATGKLVYDPELYLIYIYRTQSLCENSEAYLLTVEFNTCAISLLNVYLKKFKTSVLNFYSCQICKKYLYSKQDLENLYLLNKYSTDYIQDIDLYFKSIFTNYYGLVQE